MCLYKNVDYKNEIIGCYKVLEAATTRKFPSGQTQKYWKVECIHCKNTKEISIQKIFSKSQNGCSSCVKERFAKTNSSRWSNTSVKFVTGMYYHKTKKSAEKRNIVFDISREYMDEIFQSQEMKCRYTKYDLFFNDNSTIGNASIDRIDSKLGYIKGNIQWVHKDVNTIKWDLHHEKFIELCRVITENSKNDRD